MDLQNPSIPDPTAQNRRQFLRRTSAASVAAVVGLSGQSSTAMTDEGEFETDPFSLGVASGDPLPTSVILWTRLAPEPLTAGGGMPAEPVDVDWTIAADEEMETVVGSGTATADPEHAHTVHVEAAGLDPGTEYYYQFEAGGATSTVGRTKTAPASGTTPEEFEFAFVSCQSWPSGFYTAHRYMAEDELDLIIHLGDYIYEGGIGANGGERDTSVPQAFRTETESLERYRLQYALYKSDPDLRAAHASAPWLITRDDHEVDNNWAGDVPQDPGKQETEAFLERRAAAFKAYYEHMPFRPAQKPMGPDQKLYRNYAFGDLLEFNVLDTRLYRSNQVCGDSEFAVGCTERLREDRTMLGDAQEEWLIDNLERSEVTWDVIANQVKFAKIDYRPGPKQSFTMDHWDGYATEQNTVKRALEEHADNPVIVTGDIHFNMANDIKSADDPSKTIGAEFVGTSISSGGDGTDQDPLFNVALNRNDNWKYFNMMRGYTRCTVTPEEWTTEYRVVEYVTDPGAPVRTDATFTIEEGQPGLQPQRPTVAVDSIAVDNGSTGTADLLARWLPDGLDSGRVRLSLTHPEVATITGATVPEAFGTAEATVADDGSAATIEFVDSEQNTESAVGGVDVSLASVDIRGDNMGTADLDLAVEQFRTDAGDSPDTETRPGVVVVNGPSAVAGTVPTDPDGDGHYEDLNGNGRMDAGDIQTLFENLESDSVRLNTDAYDLNDNGRMDYDDIVSLHREISR